MKKKPLKIYKKWKSINYFEESLNNAPQKKKKKAFYFINLISFAFFHPWSLLSLCLVSFLSFTPKWSGAFGGNLRLCILLLEIQVRFITEAKKWNMSEKAFFKCQTATQFSFMFILTRSTPWVLCRIFQSRFSPSENFIDGRRSHFSSPRCPHIALM